MAYLGQDLSNVQAAESSEALPPGEYPVMVTDSSVVLTKKQDQMLKVTMTVMDGRFVNRKVFDNFLLNNHVAMSRLKALAIAGAHHSPDHISDSEELHGLKLCVILKVVIDPNYPPQNKITTFKKFEAVQPIPQLQPPAPRVPAFKPNFAPPPVVAAPAFAPAPSQSSFAPPPASAPAMPPLAPPQPIFAPAPAPVAPNNFFNTPALNNAPTQPPIQAPIPVPEPAQLPTTPATGKLPWE